MLPPYQKIFSNQDRANKTEFSLFAVIITIYPHDTRFVHEARGKHQVFLHGIIVAFYYYLY